MYWHPFFLPFFSSSLISLYPPSPSCLFYTIQHSSLIAPPSHGSLYPCSDKDLLSQTRTLAMSFVKCASTDMEHQYKLVKDISFWQTPTCRLTVTPNWRYKLTGFFFFLHKRFRSLISEVWQQTGSGLADMMRLRSQCMIHRILVLNRQAFSGLCFFKYWITYSLTKLLIKCASFIYSYFHTLNTHRQILSVPFPVFMQ